MAFDNTTGSLCSNIWEILLETQSSDTWWVESKFGIATT